MPDINLYYRTTPIGFKYLPGDRHLVRLIRRWIKGPKISGVEKVFTNLCKGFDLLKIPYTVNKPFEKLQPDEAVVVLGNGHYALQGYRQPNPVIAGIGLMTHPAEWPDLCKDYPVVKYLQHSNWTNNIYIPYFGADICATWPAGIDTIKWAPDPGINKTFDILVYNKIMWDKPVTQVELQQPIINYLNAKGLTYREITYGSYTETAYHTLLQQCRAMLFLCEHESQGFACCEALAMDVPVLAWDQGYWLDPNRITWGTPLVPATAIPFFDNRCGDSFKDIGHFKNIFNAFWDKVNNGNYSPRKYILENLTLEKSAQKMLSIIKQVYHN